jgi:type 1 glutamine amidotransferase
MNRRAWIETTLGTFAGASLLNGLALGADGPAKKVLFFTKSSGFQHSVITRRDGALSHAEKILTDVGKAKGFEVVCSKDGTLFDPDKIGQWDAFVFETTGDLTKPSPHKDGPPMSADGLKALLDAIDSGKGFVGIHCATDTFGNHRGMGGDDPYIKMIGGHFGGHGAQQVAKLVVNDPSFPGAKEFASDTFSINDEWYNNIYLADDMHVIYSHVTEGMKGPDYERPNFPQTWARKQGKGRVFYTSMGHREDVWANPSFQALVLGGLAWATGKVDADVTPNVQSATPGYKEIPAKNRKK